MSVLNDKRNAFKVIRGKREAAKVLKEIMQIHLARIADNIIKKIMRNARKATKASLLNSTKDIRSIGVNDYKYQMKKALAVISGDAFEQVRNEMPEAKRVKMAENQKRLLMGEFDELPPVMKRLIKSANDLLIKTQIADLEKAIFFQFGSSALSTDSMNQIEADLREAAVDYVEGRPVVAGAQATAANIIAQSRKEFYAQDEVLGEVVAYEFVNGDPSAKICQDLAGQVFSKDDPNLDRYWPPLHFNCESDMRAIYAGELGAREIVAIRPSKAGEDSVQFAETDHVCVICSTLF